ncbi:PQQ-dependent catabolism-associated CXXCW motif protein [Microvirga makkahensis]|uniref:PQQ-dependent catabolism-associated CXXCW motif protein n=1 Tax=Microvirga makkahensis TaxID=1128670 RepID=A0A7X3MS35_9HYPH|nr:PQQ-dependent catabolism-associated CXXCW motif protein [Microvirga makkahensis]MXQ12075.1 PQQ-dependent catabolism-associated CXXCW motif protein [Microvirga makkahensis]
MSRWRPAALALSSGIAGIITCIFPSPPSYAQHPPEPEGYRLGDYRSPTPKTLKGAVVIGTAEAERLWRNGSAAFIDVLPQPERPANLPADVLWRSPAHDSIPGALWLPNVGYGEIAVETEAYFRRGLDKASKGNFAYPLVFFCLRNCWMSWNAAKRALNYNYFVVYWYPEGTDGWTDAGLPVEKVQKSP